MENNSEMCMMTYYCDKCGKVIETVYGNAQDINSHIIAPVRVQATLSPLEGPESFYSYSYPGDLCINCKAKILTKVEQNLSELGFNLK